MNVNKGLPSALASNGVVRSRSLAYGMHARGRVVANQQGKELARRMAKLGPAEQKIVRRMAVKPTKPDTNEIIALKGNFRVGRKARDQAREYSNFANVRPSSSYKESGVGKSWEVVSKVFPQRAILTQGTRKIRVMVHYEHSPTHWGIIHPTEGQRVAHKDHITFIPNKKPKSPGPDLFGEPLRKSMEYDVPMSQSRFGGAGNVGHSYEEIEKAKKRQKPTLNPQQKIFRDLARMEAEHGDAVANGHSTPPRKVAAIARGYNNPVSIESEIANIQRSNLKHQRLVRGSKIAGATALGVGVLGAAAYGLHRRNRLSDVTKASPGAGRILEGASDAVRGSRQAGSRASRTSGQILGDISRDAAKEAKRAKLYGPRPGVALSEIAPARARTRVVMPGGQGGTHARITSHEEIAEMMRQQNMKGKELVLRPKAELPVDTRPPVPKVKKPGTDLVRVGSPAPQASKVTGSSLVPVKSAPPVHTPPVHTPNYGPERNYMPHAAAAAGIGTYGGYKVTKSLSQIRKAVDEYGNPLPNKMAGSGSTALGLAGAGTAAYGVHTMRSAGALPRTAPIANQVAEAAHNQSLAASQAAHNNIATQQAKLQYARQKRPVFNGSRKARRDLLDAQRHASVVDRNATKTAGKLVGTEAALKDIPGHMKSARNLGAAAVLGGTALAAGVLHNKVNGGS